VLCVVDGSDRIVYAASAEAARAADIAFERTWAKRRSGVVAVVPLFSLAASGQIKLRKIDGWRKIAAVLSQHTVTAAGRPTARYGQRGLPNGRDSEIRKLESLS